MPASVICIWGATQVVTVPRRDASACLVVSLGRFHAKGEDVKFGLYCCMTACACFRRTFSVCIATENVGSKL